MWLLRSEMKTVSQQVKGVDSKVIVSVKERKKGSRMNETHHGRGKPCDFIPHGHVLCRPSDRQTLRFKESSRPNFFPGYWVLSVALALSEQLEMLSSFPSLRH